MKKIKITLFFFLLGSFIFPKNAVKIGAYAGYFRSDDTLFREIYEGEDVVYGLKLGVRVWKNLSVWLSGMQFRTTGETTLLKDLTTLTLNPLHLSLRYTFRLGRINPYLEGGFTYIYYNEESDIGDKRGEGRGYALDAGLELRLSSHFNIDFGARYSRSSIQSGNNDIQLGGLQLGLAFLVVF
jgi:opacity protein-like surface antigen